MPGSMSITEDPVLGSVNRFSLLCYDTWSLKFKFFTYIFVGVSLSVYASYVGAHGGQERGSDLLKWELQWLWTAPCGC